MIITNVEGLRDPFVLLDNGVYYLYGTGAYGKGWDNTCWDCYVNDSGSLRGQWKRVHECIYQRPANAEKQFWAPEVHKYNGAYYLLASYHSSATGHRGSSVLKATSPTGPFVEISDGHITPKHWDAIDATLYIAPDGQPWLVFVHEWTCTDDGIGRMVAAKLSCDLSHLISEPVELFQADAPAWTDRPVTDGCFLHATRDGNLLMIWSNDEPDGYCVGIAHSKNGKIDGEWEHEKVPLFKKGTVCEYDGGHGMLFKDTDGKLYMCLHSPDYFCAEFMERTILLPLQETQCEGRTTLRICKE